MMNDNRSKFRHITALFVCAVFLLGSCIVPAFSESPATPTDLEVQEEEPEEETGEKGSGAEPSDEPGDEAAEEAPFEQTGEADGALITVTAEAGVFAGDVVLSISAENDEEAARMTEAELSPETGEKALILHRMFRFSGAEMNGCAQVVLEQLGFANLQKQYPDGAINVFLFYCGEKPQPVSVSADIRQDSALFTLEAQGLYDLVTVILLPGKDPEPDETRAPADEELSCMEQQSEEPAAEKPISDEALSAAVPEPEDKVEAFVTRCYWLILGRVPEAEGLQQWTQLLKARTVTAAELISGFLNSTEYQSKHKSAEDLIEIIYRTMLGRASDESGRRSWLKVILNGTTMNGLINGFSTSPEFKALCAAYGIESGSLRNDRDGASAAYSDKMVGFVRRCYQEALGRDADETGLYAWCEALAKKQLTYKEVAEGFIFSPELTARQLSNEAFVRVLYRLYLGREADAEGLRSWVQILDSGIDRYQVSDGFAGSTEFYLIIQSYDPEGPKEQGYTYILSPGDIELSVKNGASVKIEPSPQLFALDGLQWDSSDTGIFTVSSSGEIFGVYPGKATLTISNPDGSVFMTLSVTVHANYRAVLFSESTFAEGVIKRNRGDVSLMREMLSSVYGPDGGRYVVYAFDDLNADQVYDKIEHLLIAPSRAGDVSMFFFASHGDYKSTDARNAGRLYCKNKASWLELQDLAGRLSRAEGKVIVLLESCGPGAALVELETSSGDGAAGPDEAEMTDNPDFCDAVIRAFSAADHGTYVYQPGGAAADPGEKEGMLNSNLFLNEKFIVMVAAAYLQMSYSIGTDTSNLFPNKLTKGVGTSGPMPADVQYGNGDGRLTVNELFQYVYDTTSYKQTPQVYPQNCEYVLFVR